MSKEKEPRVHSYRVSDEAFRAIHRMSKQQRRTKQAVLELAILHYEKCIRGIK